MTTVIPDISKPLTREATLTKREHGQRKEIDLSFGDPTPVWRNDWDAYEVLSMEPGAADLSRLNAGAPFLFNHDSNQVVGRVVKAYLDTTQKKLRAVVRAGNSTRAKEVWADIDAEVLVSTSFGYSVDKMEPMSDINGERAFLVTRFTPSEVSTVAMPASTNVGVSRALSQPTKPQIHISMTTAETEQKGRAYEVTEINAIGRQFEKSLPNARQLADKAIQDGTSLEAFRHIVIDALSKRGEASLVIEAEESRTIGMSERELGNYSLLRAINHFAQHKTFDGLEAEASRAAEKKYKRSAPQNGLLVPWDVLRQKRDLAATTATAGGYMVGTQTMSFIDALRNKTRIADIGATSMSGIVGNIAIPRLDGEPTAYWLAENAEITESDATLGQLGLTPKRLGAYCDISKQLTTQTSGDAEMILRSTIAKILALEFDRAAINGTGGVEPTGILNTTGINTVTFGGAPTWAKIVDFEKELGDDNADEGNLAWLVTPAVRAKWKTTVKAASTAVYLWGEDGKVNSYRAESTKQVPSDKVIFGNWSDLIVATWADGMAVTIDPFTKARNNLIRIIVNMHGDVGVRHPVSFCASTDSGAQ